MLKFKKKNKCVMCNTNKNLHHFKVKKYHNSEWVITNSDLILCDKCCDKLFGEGWSN